MGGGRVQFRRDSDRLVVAARLHTCLEKFLSAKSKCTGTEHWGLIVTPATDGQGEQRGPQCHPFAVLGTGLSKALQSWDSSQIHLWHGLENDSHACDAGHAGPRCLQDSALEGSVCKGRNPWILLSHVTPLRKKIKSSFLNVAVENAFSLFLS